MTDEEQEQNEQRWLAGHRAAYSTILLECARHLDADDPLRKAAGLIAERVDTIRALRNLCDHLGLSNDWPDSLYLADIIEKHIQGYLEECEKE